MAISIDVGTYNLVCAKRNGEEIKYRKEVNAFLEISLDSRHTFNMLKASGVPLIEKEKIAYIVGDSAIQFSHAMPQVSPKRPMKDGCLNPLEKDAYRILSIMIHSLIGEVPEDKTILYYSVPANAVNSKTDADFHQKMLEDIFKKYKINNKTVQAFPMNEALALIYAELGHKAYTGISASFGSGQINFCYSVFSHPVFSFSVVNSGDWIDEQAAKAAGENVSTINKAKHNIDLMKNPTNIIERAINSQYRIMIEKTMALIKQAIVDAGNSIRVENPVDMIIAGGTSMPNGFTEIVRETVKQLNYPIPIGEIRRPDDPLYTVARGLLVAAENAI